MLAKPTPLNINLGSDRFAMFNKVRDIPYDVRHVNGEQSSGDRGDIIGEFADAPKALLTNARCLTEGINIPAVDMVAFVDPRQSQN